MPSNIIKAPVLGIQGTPLESATQRALSHFSGLTEFARLGHIRIKVARLTHTRNPVLTDQGAFQHVGDRFTLASSAGTPHHQEVYSDGSIVQHSHFRPQRDDKLSTAEVGGSDSSNVAVRSESHQFVRIGKLGRVQMYAIPKPNKTFEIHILLQNQLELSFVTRYKGGRTKRSLVLDANASVYVNDLATGKTVNKGLIESVSGFSSRLQMRFADQDALTLDFSFSERESGDVRGPRLRLRSHQANNINYPLLAKILDKTSKGSCRPCYVEDLGGRSDRYTQSAFRKFRVVLSNGDAVVFEVQSNHHAQGRYHTNNSSATLHRYSDGRVLPMQIDGEGSGRGSVRIQGRGYDLTVPVVNSSGGKGSLIAYLEGIEIKSVPKSQSRSFAYLNDLKTGTSKTEDPTVEVAGETFRQVMDVEVSLETPIDLPSEYDVADRLLVPDSGSVDDIQELIHHKNDDVASVVFTGRLAKHKFVGQGAPSVPLFTLEVPLTFSKASGLTVALDSADEGNLILPEFSYLVAQRGADGSIQSYKRMTYENVPASVHVTADGVWSLDVMGRQLRVVQYSHNERVTPLFGLVMMNDASERIPGADRRQLRKRFQRRVNQVDGYPAIERPPKPATTVTKPRPKATQRETDKELVTEILNRGSIEQFQADLAEAREQAKDFKHFPEGEIFYPVPSEILLTKYLAINNPETVFYFSVACGDASIKFWRWTHVLFNNSNRQN